METSPSGERIRQAVIDGRWWDADKELKAENYASHLLDVYITTFIDKYVTSYLENLKELRQDVDWFYFEKVLPHCNTEQLDEVLSTATRQGMWDIAGCVLLVGGSETQRVRTIQRACDKATDWDLEYYILPHSGVEITTRQLAKCE
jgi:hypothetical protein